MNEWINGISELTGMRQTVVDLSLSDVSLFLQQSRFLWILGLAMVIYLATALDGMWIDHHKDQKSDIHNDQV